MRIFVSYARVDRAYCVKIAQVLDFHDVWYDQKLTSGDQWWKEIQRRIEWCEGLIYLISSDSLASQYCRNEFETAQALGKHVFPVLIDRKAEIPEDFRILHYIDLTNGLTVEAVHDLLRSIYMAEQQDWVKKTAGTGENDTPASSGDTGRSALTAVVSAMEMGQYAQAIELIQELKARNEKPVFIDLDKMLAQAEESLAVEQNRRQMEREYRDIYHLIRTPITYTIGIEAFSKFHETYPDYDPDNLSVHLHGKRPSPSGARKRLNEVSSRIPLLEWCDIPSGKVRIESGGRGAEQVDRFLMARYPVTNMQYHLFLRAPNGYCDPRWWDFAPEARAWRDSAIRPQASVFKGADRPRENVNWYDARAYCNWLSAVLKVKIVLPTLRQRQRSVMGDDNRSFPWGDIFDKDRCNTRESGIRMTTVVNRYSSGVSPYGVYDLSGNVWEWCQDTVPDADPSNETGYKVVVHGGAFLSPHTRAHVAHYLLVPPQTGYASIGFRVICVNWDDAQA
ncbi:MAG: SUMF1/EgtB/PvdO family nonheme iron enzyme [Chloroflexi bacterium]|nr:SUMF1/EgtB/PvdO family nonheme iron enzyme [Chloroflexota bacterium]